MSANAMLPDGAVLLVSEPLNPGGLAIYTRSIMQGLSENAIPHPLLISTRPEQALLSSLEWQNVKVFNELFWSVWRPFIFRKLVAWAREQEPLLIHGLSARTAPVCSRLAQALKIPFIVTVHHFQRRGDLRAEKHCYRIIAVSESLRENVVNEAKIAKELVDMIPLGIRAPQTLRPRPVDALSPQTGTVPLISSFGKLIPRKDFSVFLQMARLIVDEIGDNCSFVISGEGPCEQPLRKLARELKIDKQVTFCHGSVAHDNLLQDTDVYVQCSRAEGFGSMALQAMVYGAPIVATATGGILSLIKDGKTGFLVPVGDAATLAARVLKLLTDRDLSLRLGAAARQYALANYNLVDMLSNTIKLYAEAISTATTRQ